MTRATDMADSWNSGYEAGWNAGRIRGRADIADIVWRYIRDKCGPITAKGETAKPICVDEMFSIIEPIAPARFSESR